MTTIRTKLHAADPYENFPIAGAQLDMQGWHSSDPLFGELIASLRPQRIIEVGTWKGASAIGMARLAKKHGLKPEIICIDTWLGAIEFWTSHNDPDRYQSLRLRNGYPSVYYTFLANVILSGQSDLITPFPQTSINAARWLNMQGEQADLIYIDGSHEEADALADIAAYWPILSPGGAMFGDDYSAYWPSVVRAVKSFARQNGLVLEEHKEFWVIRKPHGAATTPPKAVLSQERPLLLVHADESQRNALLPFVEQLGYQFVATDACGTASLEGSAIWLQPGQRFDGLEAARSRFGDVQSLFWVEQDANTAEWCQRWSESFAWAGGAGQVIALHPYRPLTVQRNRCETLCRRCGVDLTALRLQDHLVPQAPAPERPDPADGMFVAIMETLLALGLNATDFFSFANVQRIEAKAEVTRLEKPDGGGFESYGATHFMLHPPAPGKGWTRLYLRGLDWQNYRYLSTTLSLPSDQAPAVRFQWNIVSPEGQRVHMSETVLNARDVMNWVVPLPDFVPADSIAVLATRVDVAPTHAFAWSTWRDPILFS